MTTRAPGGPATRFHCERAWLGGEALETDVVVTCVGGVVSHVEAGVAPPAGASRLDGVVLPGFANRHSHAFHRALRGRTSRGRDTFWSWRECMYALAARLTPDTYRELATATFVEMLSAGFTSVTEFHYLHHDVDGRRYAAPNEMALALADAAAASGIGLTLLDACYLHSAPTTAPEGVQRRFADRDAGAWASRTDDLASELADRAQVSLGAAIHSVRAVDPEGAAAVAAWAAAREAPLHAHVSEQPAENERSLAAYGATPTAVLHDAGALDARFTAVHATHLTDDDRALLGDAGATACVCPTTEEDLADGLCDVAGLVAAGVGLVLGTDSNAVVDGFAEARGLEGHERLRSLRRGTCSPGALARALTTTSGLGELVGGRCDLVAISTGSRRLAGADADDLLAAVLGAATADDVATVVVGGEVVVDDGHHRGGSDAAALLAAAVSGAWG